MFPTIKYILQKSWDWDYAKYNVVIFLLLKTLFIVGT